MTELEKVDKTTGIDPIFWKAIGDFSKKLSEEDDVLIVSHHDADGVSACAIVKDMFSYLEKNADFMVMKQLDSVTINRVKAAKQDVVVFTDMGSGHLSLLEKNLNKKYYIIDHHPPEKDYELQINPHTYGYDGGIDISGAGMAYLVAKSLGNDRMAHLSIVGAVGDMQDNGGKLHSLNRQIMADAVSQGTLKVRNDLRLFGRQSRILTQMLAYASDPVLPKLTGDRQACAQFLKSNGIDLEGEDGWRTYVDLTHLERKELTTALYILLLDNNVPEFVIQRMIGEVYTLLNEVKKTELRDAKEYATLLNACGRQNSSEIGVKVCLGDREEELKNAKRLLNKHRRHLSKGIRYLSTIGVKTMPNLYHFDSQGEISESIIGVVAGMAYSAKIIPPNKPVLAFADDKEDPSMLKVSARTTWSQVRGGIHLGNTMRSCSEAFGGEGGGHDIAAGARIPREKKQEFLDKVNDTFKSQISGK